MYLADRLVLDAPKRLEGGALAVRARAARVGTYEYSGREVDPDNKHGLRDQAVVHVLRDDAAVFDERAVRSFIGKPITDDHPTQAVTADNWRQHARGTVMGAMRDGDYLAFDLLLTDAEAIAKVEAGKRELSNGYAATLEFGEFTAADGTKCDARQASIAGNHVALVDRGRAGPDCRIADAAPCVALTQDQLSTLHNNDGARPVKKILLDGLTVDISDAQTAEDTIRKLEGERNEARGKVTAADAKAVTDAATIVAKDAEIAKLKQDLADAKPTLQQLRDAGKAFAVIEGKAKAAGVTITDAMDEAAIMKAVVDKAMPGNAYEGDHVRIAFDALTKDLKVADEAVQPIIATTIVGDAAAEAKAWTDSTDFNAWRNK